MWNNSHCSKTCYSTKYHNICLLTGENTRFSKWQSVCKLLSSNETWPSHQLLIPRSKIRISATFWAKFTGQAPFPHAVQSAYCSANPAACHARGLPVYNRNRIWSHKLTLTHHSCFIDFSSTSPLIKANQLNKS